MNTRIAVWSRVPSVMPNQIPCSRDFIWSDVTIMQRDYYIHFDYVPWHPCLAWIRRAPRAGCRRSSSCRCWRRRRAPASLLRWRRPRAPAGRCWGRWSPRGGSPALRPPSARRRPRWRSAAAPSSRPGRRRRRRRRWSPTSAPPRSPRTWPPWDGWRPARWTPSRWKHKKLHWLSKQASVIELHIWMSSQSMHGVLEWVDLLVTVRTSLLRWSPVQPSASTAGNWCCQIYQFSG